MRMHTLETERPRDREGSSVITLHVVCSMNCLKNRTRGVQIPSYLTTSGKANRVNLVLLHEHQGWICRVESFQTATDVRDSSRPCTPPHLTRWQPDL